MISGAWLEANTPTSLAMAGPRGGFGSGVAHLLQELGLRHSRDDEIESKQVGIDPGGEKYDIVALDRLAHLGLQGVAIEDLPAVGAIFLAERRGALKIEEKLAQPVVSHVAILPWAHAVWSGVRTSQAACASSSFGRRSVCRREADAVP